MHLVTTREKLLDATLRVLTEQGIAKASARTIAAEAGVNQALVFYHFGTIDDLLAEACAYGARARVETHRAALRSASSFTELVAVGRAIHAQERAAGNVALLGQLLAGAASHPALAEPTAAGLGLWVAEVEEVLGRLLGRSALDGLVDVPGLARALSASFVGLELYEGVDADGAARAFDALDQLGSLLAALDTLGPLERKALTRRLRRDGRRGGTATRTVGGRS